MARTRDEERRRTAIHNAIGMWLLVLGAAGVVQWWTAQKLDVLLADVEGAYATATLLTRDAAPGDEIAIRVIAPGSQKTVIKGIRGRLKRAGTMTPFVSADDAPDDRVTFRATVPLDAPEDGVLAITLAVDLELGGYIRSETTDTLSLELPLRSASARSRRAAFDLGLAALAWLVACATCYVVTRWRPVGDRGPSLPSGASEGMVRLVLWGVLVGLAAIAAIGDVAFVRPLQRTTAATSESVTLGLLVVWLLALALGSGLGLVGRTRDLRWWRARLRPVIGTAPPVGDAFRSAGSVLPPSLSREVDPRPVAEVLAAITAAGFTLDKRAILEGGKPVARIATRLATVRPEQLGLDVFDGYDATPLTRALTALYGPLEVSSRFTPPTIVDPS